MTNAPPDQSSWKTDSSAFRRWLAPAALIAAMSSAAVADVTGLLAATAAITGTFLAFNQRRKILRTYETQMEAKCSELIQAVEQQLNRAIELFYGEITTAFQPLAAFCVAQRRIYEPVLQRADELKIVFERLAAELG